MENSLGLSTTLARTAVTTETTTAATAITAATTNNAIAKIKIAEAATGSVLKKSCS